MIAIEYSLEAATLIFLSLWKTYVPPMVGVGFSMSYAEAVGFTMAGALLSITSSLYLERPITALVKRSLQALRGPKTIRPRFYPRLRKVLRMYRKYGFWGLMVLTPVLVGLPVGIWIAVRLGSKREHVAMVCAACCLGWSSLAYYAGLNGLEWLAEQ